MRLKYNTLLIALFVIITSAVFAQDGTGIVRGVIYDKDNGEPVTFANVFLGGTSKGTTSDINGFFNLVDVPNGEYTLFGTFIGYDTASVQIKVRDGQVTTQTLYMQESATQLTAVNVSARKIEKTTEVKISSVTLTPKDIKVMPSTGGEPDLAQYLQVLPGVIFTGDQGGQLYIRGGSPVQNKVLLDGMTIYNPFHSIGFFSVFETETIRNVEVLTGGFNAEYGGRTSAVIDIITRDGNKARYGGVVSASPFQAKALVEGPLKKFEEGGGSSSFMFTGKRSYLDATSPLLYSYAATDSSGLPYNFTDVYGKLSFNSANGSKLNIFGFNFIDNVNFPNVAQLNWDASGVGANFNLIPQSTRMILGGRFAYSNYVANIVESDGAPRNTSIGGFEAALNFTIFGDDSELKYGFEVNGFRTEFDFINFLGIKIEEIENTTELAGFIRYRKATEKFVFEPSFRIHYYASLSDAAFEPRLGVKYNVSDNFRLKFAGGLYSQNLISTINERDVVNLFVGFLSSPEQVFELNTFERSAHRLQKSVHGIAGVEIDLGTNTEINIEPYIKEFTQLIALNRNKTSVQEPNFRTETGSAYGIDFLLKYDKNYLYVWLAYSLGYVRRFDGEQEYPTNFDRRHNINLVTSYAFGGGRDWELSARWNLGSGFPFTLTQGFYQFFNFQDGIDSDYLTENGDLGIIYSDIRNSGRLPYYHRLDVSLKKTIEISKYSQIQITGSITNVYNRNNIFYFDRVEYDRVDQLPILPSIAISYTF